MADILVPYPENFLTPSRILLSRLNGTEVPLSQVLHCAWQLEGVALGMLLPDAPIARSTSLDPKATLEYLVAAGEASDVKMAISIDWKQVLQVVIDLILKFLEGINAS